MHISMTSALRRTITPSRPSEKSAMVSQSSSWCPIHGASCGYLDHGERGDDRRDQQHRGQLEMQPVLAAGTSTENGCVMP